MKLENITGDRLIRWVAGEPDIYEVAAIVPGSEYRSDGLAVNIEGSNINFSSTEPMDIAVEIKGHKSYLKQKNVKHLSIFCNGSLLSMAVVVELGNMRFALEGGDKFFSVRIID